MIFTFVFAAKYLGRKNLTVIACYEQSMYRSFLVVFSVTELVANLMLSPQVD